MTNIVSTLNSIINNLTGDSVTLNITPPNNFGYTRSCVFYRKSSELSWSFFGYYTGSPGVAGDYIVNGLDDLNYYKFIVTLNYDEYSNDVSWDNLDGLQTTDTYGTISVASSKLIWNTRDLANDLPTVYYYNPKVSGDFIIEFDSSFISLATPGSTRVTLDINFDSINYIRLYIYPTVTYCYRVINGGPLTIYGSYTLGSGYACKIKISRDSGQFALEVYDNSDSTWHALGSPFVSPNSVWNVTLLQKITFQPYLTGRTAGTSIWESNYLVFTNSSIATPSEEIETWVTSGDPPPPVGNPPVIDISSYVRNDETGSVDVTVSDPSHTAEVWACGNILGPDVKFEMVGSKVGGGTVDLDFSGFSVEFMGETILLPVQVFAVSRDGSNNYSQPSIDFGPSLFDTTVDKPVVSGISRSLDGTIMYFTLSGLPTENSSFWFLYVNLSGDVESYLVVGNGDHSIIDLQADYTYRFVGFIQLENGMFSTPIAFESDAVYVDPVSYPGKRKAILDKVISLLSDITIANGFPLNVVTVSTQDIDINDVRSEDTPHICLSFGSSGNNSFITTGSNIDSIMTIVIDCYIASQPGVNPTLELDKILWSVEHAILNGTPNAPWNDKYKTASLGGVLNFVYYVSFDDLSNTDEGNLTLLGKAYSRQSLTIKYLRSTVKP